MKRRAGGNVAEAQDGRLISSDSDAPRLCVGTARTVGVYRLEARNALELRVIAENFRQRGMQRSEDGALCAGQFDLVVRPEAAGGDHFALYIPFPDEARAVG